MSERRRQFMAYIVVLVLGAVLTIALVFNVINAFHRTPNQTFTVTGKENVKANESSKYLIFNNVTTYEVEDSFVYWRWDSSDVYGRLTIGHTYRATLQGYRIPFLSMYPNIIGPVEVTVDP